MLEEAKIILVYIMLVTTNSLINYNHIKNVSLITTTHIENIVNYRLTDKIVNKISV